MGLHSPLKHLFVLFYWLMYPMASELSPISSDLQLATHFYSIIGEIYSRLTWFQKSSGFAGNP